MSQPVNHKMQETAVGWMLAPLGFPRAELEKNKNTQNRVAKIAGRLPAKSFSVVEQRWPSSGKAGDERGPKAGGEGWFSGEIC